MASEQCSGILRFRWGDKFESMWVHNMECSGLDRTSSMLLGLEVLMCWHITQQKGWLLGMADEHDAPRVAFNEEQCIAEMVREEWCSDFKMPCCSRVCQALAVLQESFALRPKQKVLRFGTEMLDRIYRYMHNDLRLVILCPVNILCPSLLIQQEVSLPYYHHSP